jgi:hypothetical protein
MQRLAHNTSCFDTSRQWKRFLSGRIWPRFHYNSGYHFLQASVRRDLEQFLSSLILADVVWINGGELFGPNAIQCIHKAGLPSILYNNDDPTGRRDGRRFLQVRKALPAYDLCVVLREVNREEYHRLGAKRTYRVWMSYDEIAHCPPAADEINATLRSEVAFIGTWMPERGPFMARLVEAGIPLSIWGDRWHKSPEWSKLKSSWRGPGLYGREYSMAIAGAKVCLGLLSKGNRDLHTRRSVEIPYIGGLLCAERTSEHQMLYREGTEALLWSDAAECADLCKTVLADDALRETIRMGGMRRIRELHLGNEDVCAEVLAVLQDPDHVVARPFYQ